MGEWKLGLCGCFDNLQLCCFANIMSPLTVGKVVGSFGEKDRILWAGSAGLAPMCALGLARTKVRERDGIPGSFMGDCCVSACFAPCVLNQLAVHTGVWEPLLPKDQKMNRVDNE